MIIRTDHVHHHTLCCTFMLSQAASLRRLSRSSMLYRHRAQRYTVGTVRIHTYWHAFAAYFTGTTGSRPPPSRATPSDGCVRRASSVYDVRWHGLASDVTLSRATWALSSRKLLPPSGSCAPLLAPNAHVASSISSSALECALCAPH